MSVDVEMLYRPHLSDGDRRLLATAAPGQGLVDSLGSAEVEAAVLGSTPDLGPAASMPATPFLTFAVAVHRSAHLLASASYVEEWTGPRQRVPVFDVAPLRDFLSDPVRRFFMIELLASYTHVSSGVRWERTSRGWRRRRFSELDPLRLAELLEAVGPEERPGVYRRLGDLALFLTGVFPDHTALEGPMGAQADRLLRLSGLRDTTSEELSGLALLEYLGSRWYRLAGRSVNGVPTASLAVAADFGRRFTDARRILNLTTDRYLFPLRQRWFGR